MTKEQLDLLYAHYARINPPPKQDTKARDEYYDAEEANVEGYSAEEARAEGRLPIQDFEHFEDSDFDAEWNTVDEEDSDIIDKNPSPEGSETFVGGEEQNINLDDSEWEEV